MSQALVCGTGYTGEDGVEILPSPEDARRPSGARCSTPAPSPAGLGARDTLRLEVCFHLHGNDMGPDRNPIEAGLGWCCKEETGFIGSEAVAAARADGTGGEAGRRSPIEGGDPAGRQPDPRRRRARRRRHQRHLLALARDRDRDGLRPIRPGGRAGTELEIDVRGRVRRARVHPRSPSTNPKPDQTTQLRERKRIAEASYPDDLRYHAEHDWAKIDGEEATFGVTWYAQDALGEVVFFDPPEVGSTVTKDEPYAEVESVKAVSDVIAPLSGEIIAVNEAAELEPGADQQRPLRRGLDGQGQAQRTGRSRQPARRRYASCSLTEPGQPASLT